MKVDLVTWLRWHVAPHAAVTEGTLASIGVYEPKDSRVPAKQCGQARHVGHCPLCQRAQLAKWDAHLARAAGLGRHR